MSSRDMPARHCWSMPRYPPGVAQMCALPRRPPNSIQVAQVPQFTEENQPGPAPRSQLLPSHQIPAREGLNKAFPITNTRREIRTRSGPWTRLRPFQIEAQDPVPPDEPAGRITPDPANTPPTRIGPIDRVILGVGVAVERLRAGGTAGEAVPLQEAPLGRIIPARPQGDQAGLPVLQFAREAQRIGRAARLRLRRAKGGVAVGVRDADARP